MNFELVLLLFCIVTWLCLIKDYRCSLCGACLSYLSVNNVFFFVCVYKFGGGRNAISRDGEAWLSFTIKILCSLGPSEASTSWCNRLSIKTLHLFNLLKGYTFYVLNFIRYKILIHVIGGYGENVIFILHLFKISQSFTKCYKGPFEKPYFLAQSIVYFFVDCA